MSQFGVSCLDFLVCLKNSWAHVRRPPVCPRDRGRYPHNPCAELLPLSTEAGLLLSCPLGPTSQDLSDGQWEQVLGFSPCHTLKMSDKSFLEVWPRLFSHNYWLTSNLVTMGNISSCPQKETLLGCLVHSHGPLHLWKTLKSKKLILLADILAGLQTWQ